MTNPTCTSVFYSYLKETKQINNQFLSKTWEIRINSGVMPLLDNQNNEFKTQLQSFT